MKRVLASLGATVAALVALLGFKTHPPEVAAASTQMQTSTSSSPAPSAGSSGASSLSSTSSTSSSTSSTSTATKTIKGASEDTRWGPVQVEITVSGSKIIAVDVIEYPENNNRDEEINSYAVPELVSQALSAQSANIDGVSGATYTTDGFEESLQSAISKI